MLKNGRIITSDAQYIVISCNISGCKEGYFLIEIVWKGSYGTTIRLINSLLPKK